LESKAKRAGEREREEESGREGALNELCGLGGEGYIHRMPESLRALFRMVSFTAANTRRMLDVLVACVKL
jgi:hypothetical protein